MSFLYFFHFILEISKITKNNSFMFPTSSYFTVPLFSFFVFFSIHSLKYRKTVNTHVNVPCKLLSPPIPVDLTRFSLYDITKVSRKPKHTHTLNIDFKTYTFRARFSPDQILTLLSRMGTV